MSAADQDGYVLIPISNDRGGMNVRVRTFVPANSRVVASAYAAFPTPDPDEPKSDRVTPIAIAAWYSDQQARLDRCEILARPIGSVQTVGEAGEPESENGVLVLGVETVLDTLGRDSYEGFDFAKNCGNVLNETTSPAFVASTAMPRVRAGYDSVRVLVLNGVNFDEIDTSQRKALLDFLTSGGTLVLPAPPVAIDPAESWFAPYFPVDIIGRRHARAIDGRVLGERLALELREAIELVEAVPASGTIVLQDDHFVHASYKEVGLGRVVFVSFPINSIDIKQEAAESLWRKLIVNPRRPASWAQTELGQMVVKPDTSFPVFAQAPTKVRPMILDSLVGQPTVAWRSALIVAGGYVGVVFLIQLLSSGRRRVTAFVLTLVASAVTAGLLVSIALLQTRREDLIYARFSTIDLAPDQGGLQREILTFLGKDDPDLTLIARRTDVSIRPLTANPDSPPVVQLNPFTAPNAGSFAGKLERAWISESSVPENLGAYAFGKFDKDGLQLRFDNRFGGSLETPLLIWGMESFSLGDISSGDSTSMLSLQNRNLSGDYTNVTTFASEMTKLRGQIVEASLARVATGAAIANENVDMGLVVGWLSTGAPQGLLIESSASPVDRSQAMVRFPLQIEASTPGSSVKIPPPFVRLVAGESRGLPYDPAAGRWLDRSQQEGTWHMCFVPPAQVGAIKPARIWIEANLDAPEHTVTLRRAGLQGGAVPESPDSSAPVIATWRGALGAQSASFEADASDVDAKGRIWFSLTVEKSSASIVELQPAWSFRSFEIGIEGTILEK